MNEDEATLVERALQGDQDAFRQLVVAYQNKVLTLLTRMLRDRELALDLSQEVFLKAYRKLDQLSSGRKFGSWVMQMAHNRALDWIKKRRPDSILTDYQDPKTEHVLALQGNVSDAERPEDVVERLSHPEVLQLLDHIDIKHRTILILRFLEGYPFAQIAEILDLPLSTVKFRKFWAIKQLRKMMNERRRARGEAGADDEDGDEAAEAG